MRRHLIWRHIPIVARARFGATFFSDLHDVIHSYLYFFGVWEPGITRLYQTHLRPGDCVIDIGTNVGAHALLAGMLVGPTGQAHAIEASPTIHRHLVANIARNGLSQVRSRNVAVTEQEGPVTVYLHPDHNLGGTTTVEAEAARRHATEEAIVHGLPLNRIVADDVIRSARIVKIDVEGAEWPVLRGMRDTLELLPADCLILIEVYQDALETFGANLPMLYAMLAEARFMPLEIVNTYDPPFYIRTTGPLLRPISSSGPALLDLVFARSELRSALLASRLGQ